MAIEDLNIKFRNPEQIINMGGPWIGELFVNNKKICDKAIHENIVIHPKSNGIFFIKYHQNSKWQRNNYFTINRFDIANNKLQESTLKFDCLYINEGESENEIITFNAFHCGKINSGKNRSIDSLDLKNYR